MADQIELERLLARAATDPVERPAFARALLASDVLILGGRDLPTGHWRAQAETDIALVSWEDDAGPITPFFTSEAMLRRTLDARPGTDHHFVRLPCRTLFEGLRGQRLVLNPHGATGKVFAADEVEALLDGREPGLTLEVMGPELEVMARPAADVPPELTEVLARYLATRPGVRAAQLGWMKRPDGREGFLVVVVADDERAVLDGFGSLGVGELTGGHRYDVIVVQPGGAGPLPGVPPFYTGAPPQQDPPKRRWPFARRSD
jgi:hypothetical protein